MPTNLSRMTEDRKDLIMAIDDNLFTLDLSFAEEDYYNIRAIQTENIFEACEIFFQHLETKPCHVR